MNDLQTTAHLSHAVGLSITVQPAEWPADVAGRRDTLQRLMDTAGRSALAELHRRFLAQPEVLAADRVDPVLIYLPAAEGPMCFTWEEFETWLAAQGVES